MDKKTERRVLELALFGQETEGHRAVRHHNPNGEDAKTLMERLREIRRLLYDAH